MAKKTENTFTATLVLNPEKAGAWLATVSVATLTQDDEQGSVESNKKTTAWKNASAGKRWIKEQVQAMTPRKSVKMSPVKFDKATEKPTSFSGVLEFKA